MTFHRCAAALRGPTATLTLLERRYAAALRKSGTTPYAAAAEIMSDISLQAQLEALDVQIEVNEVELENLPEGHQDALRAALATSQGAVSIGCQRDDGPLPAPPEEPQP